MAMGPREMLPIFVVAALLLQLAQGQIDVTVPGTPLVDGPAPHYRLGARPLNRNEPYVIGHRGDSGEFPEHTELAYRAAINHGANFVECCDIAITADLVPVCRHEPEVANTTNAMELFPDRVRTYTIDGSPSTGIHLIDLTLEEVRKLRARERLYHRSQAYNDLMPVMTFADCATMARNFLWKENIVVGIYPETKHPTWHDAIIAERWPAIYASRQKYFQSRMNWWNFGRRNRYRRRNPPVTVTPPAPTMTDLVLEVAHMLGYNNPINSPAWLQQPIFLQSFESQNLQEAAGKTQMPRVQLLSGLSSRVPDKLGLTYGQLVANISYVAAYAQGLGPAKTTLLVVNATATPPIRSSGLAERAQAAGMQVHLYTLRNERSTPVRPLAPTPNYPAPFTDIASEFEWYFKTLGVDGGFTDFPGTLVPWMRNETAKGTAWPQKARLCPGC